MTDNGQPERLLKPGEVAALFRVDRRTVARWALEGKLGFVRTPGGQHRYREAEVQALFRTKGRP